MKVCKWLKWTKKVVGVHERLSLVETSRKRKVGLNCITKAFCFKKKKKKQNLPFHPWTRFGHEIVTRSYFRMISFVFFCVYAFLKAEL